MTLEQVQASRVEWEARTGYTAKAARLNPLNIESIGESLKGLWQPPAPGGLTFKAHGGLDYYSDAQVGPNEVEFDWLRPSEQPRIVSATPDVSAEAVNFVVVAEGHPERTVVVYACDYSTPANMRADALAGYRRFMICALAAKVEAH